MRRYQPNSNPSDVQEGTIVRGRNGLYWISQNIDGVRQWQLYDGLIPSDSESSESMDINIPEYRPPRTSLDNEPGLWSPIEEQQQELLPQTPEAASTLLRLLNESGRTLTRSPSQYDLTNYDEEREGIYEEREGIYEEREDMYEPPRTLTRSFAMTDLNEQSQPRTVRYNDEDEISYMSFSTDPNSDEDRFSVYAGQEPEEFESDYEEDSDDFDDVSSDAESVINYKSNILDKCLNESPVTLMNYEETDLNDLFIVHLPNNEGKFVKGSCLRKDEMKEILKSDNNVNAFPPNYIMSIYKTPSSIYPDDLLTGLTGKPTGKIIVRLPTNQIYITFGSMKRVLRNPTKQWFALPLYGGKARRVGNVGGIYGASMNHGQVPGFKIYKLFNYNEIKSNVAVKETHDDFPHTMMHDTMISLFDLVGETPIQIFIQNIINDLIQSETRLHPIIPRRNSSLQSRRERRFGNPPDI